jgi:hypothetical protein
MRPRAPWIAVIALLGLARAAAAQGAAPEEAARGFFAALDGHRWDEAAGYVLPAAARQQRELDLSMRLARAAMLAKDRRSGSFAITSSGTVDPEQLRLYGSTPVRGLRGVRTLAEAAGLPPEAYIARVMEAATVGPPGAVLARPTKHRLLGVVAENDSVAHAVYRGDGFRGGTVDPATAEILLLRKQEGRWYVVPDQMMFVMASMAGDFDPPP